MTEYKGDWKVKGGSIYNTDNWSDGIITTLDSDDSDSDE